MTPLKLPPLALAVTFALATLFTAPEAAALNSHAVSAGMACHAANPAATRFIAGNHYLTNSNTTAQYAMCYLPLTDTTSEPQQIQYLGVHIQSSMGGTVTCTAQTGAYIAATIMVHSSAVRTDTMTGSDIGALSWGAGTLSRGTTSDALILNCKMDPGTRLGLISYGDG